MVYGLGGENLKVNRQFPQEAPSPVVDTGVYVDSWGAAWRERLKSLEEELGEVSQSHLSQVLKDEYEFSKWEE